MISGNPFDVIGAISAGMKGAWIKRSEEMVFDPMAGGGVIPDTCLCLAFNRRCWAFDMAARPNRHEIKPRTWRFSPDDELSWPVNSK